MKKPTCNDNLPEWARGWLAGLIDGEGTLTVKRRRRVDGSVKYEPIIVINNTSRELLAKIREVCGCGTIVKHSERYTLMHPNWNVVWRLEIKGSFNVVTILKQIYPFLIAKKRHAEILMKICEKLIEAYNTKQRVDSTSIEKLVSELKELTHRGRKH